MQEQNITANKEETSDLQSGLLGTLFRKGRNFLLKEQYSYARIIEMGMKFSLGKPKPHIMLMTSAKITQKSSAFFVSAMNRRILYVDKCCANSIIRIAFREHIFKNETAKPVGNDYCGNCFKPSCA